MKGDRLTVEERDSGSGPYTPFHQILAEALEHADKANRLVLAAEALLHSKRDLGHFKSCRDHSVLLVGALEEAVYSTYFDSTSHLPDVSK